MMVLSCKEATSAVTESESERGTSSDYPLFFFYLVISLPDGSEATCLTQTRYLQLDLTVKSCLVLQSQRQS